MKRICVSAFPGTPEDLSHSAALSRKVFVDGGNIGDEMWRPWGHLSEYRFYFDDPEAADSALARFATYPRPPLMQTDLPEYASSSHENMFNRDDASWHGWWFVVILGQSRERPCRAWYKYLPRTTTVGNGPRRLSVTPVAPSVHLSDMCEIPYEALKKPGLVGMTLLSNLG